MSYSNIANRVIFSNAWEAYPYSRDAGGPGDVHLFRRPGSNWLPFYNGEIPAGYLKLNVRRTLKELDPHAFPNMDTVGYAVREVFRELGINNYIAVEDRGWELSDYWATLEAVFIPKEEYVNKILPKIQHVAQTSMTSF